MKGVKQVFRHCTQFSYLTRFPVYVQGFYTSFPCCYVGSSVFTHFSVLRQVLGAVNKVNEICMCLYRYMYVRMQIINVVSYIILVQQCML